MADGVSCPSSPPSVSEPPSGVTSDFYNSDGELVQQTGPSGGTTIYAYDQAGQVYCTVGPDAYADGKTCPSTEPSSAPTPGDDDYLGATIDTYNSAGQLAQETSPTGGITLYSYDGDGNLYSQSVESGVSGAPAVTTTYAYDADDQQVSETTAAGSGEAATTLSYYDPDGNAYCSVSADAYASGSYQCPAWQASWVASPPAAGSLYSSSPSADQAEAVTTSFYDADGELAQQTTPDQGTTISVYDDDGDVVCAEDATDMEATLAADSSATYPYTCPSAPLTTAPSSGSMRRPSTTPMDNRSARATPTGTPLATPTTPTATSSPRPARGARSRPTVTTGRAPVALPAHPLEVATPAACIR